MTDNTTTIITIYRSSGTEGTCPHCARIGAGGNAMLNNNYYDDKDMLVSSLKCRDCGYTVIEPEIIEIPYEELISIKY